MINMNDKELLTDVIKRIRSMAVQPPWCENLDLLRKWIEGYETCQEYVVGIVESTMTKEENT